MKTFAINKGGVSLIVQIRNNSKGKNVAVDIEMSSPMATGRIDTITMFARLEGEELNELKSIFIQDENKCTQ